MARRTASLLTLLVLAAVLPAGAQLIPGIGYPGGGRQGRRYPQGNPQPSRPDSSPNSIIGYLRKIDDKTIVVESVDGNIATISISGSTKYRNDSGGNAKIGDFQPGDNVNLSTTQDNKKVYHASSMSLVHEGTAEEHSKASMATEDTSHPIFGSPGANPESGSSPNPDRPVLHRAASASASDSPAPSTPPPSSSSDDDHPRLRRPNAPSSASPVSEDTPTSAPPQLKRAAATTPPPPPLQTDPDSSSTVARVPRSVPAGSSGPPAMATGNDPVIDQARDAALTFSETLPNYVVKQFTTRYMSAPTRRGGGSSWQALDVVSADVIEEGGEEKYKNILVNGKPPVTDIEKSGSWSKGEFSTMLKDVVSPYTNADFHSRRSATIVNRAAFRYDFTVEQPNSHWHIEADGQSWMPAYNGAIWIDKENYRVLRIEMFAQDMPRNFPLDQVEWAIDYDYVVIGDKKYLLPAHSETLSCVRAGTQCTRNVIEFRNYRKFTAETNITFEP
jgi:hypothetical protein